LCIKVCIENETWRVVSIGTRRFGRSVIVTGNVLRMEPSWDYQNTVPIDRPALPPPRPRDW
jgi:hypothetical protein